MVNTNLTDREKEIVRLLAEDSGISVSQLSEKLSVSAVTIRNDLNNLAQKGVVVRTRGGAAPAFHPNVVVRQNLRVEEKNRIAQTAAAVVNDGDTIMIDGFSRQGGLTTHLVEGAAIVRRMAERAEKTILIADSSKFGKIGFVHVLPVNEVQTLITDEGLPAAAEQELREAGIEVIKG